MHHRLLLATALALVAPLLVAADDRLEPGKEGPLVVDGKPPCVVYVPTDYVAGTRVPLILFMHGSGASPGTAPFRSACGGKGYLICGLSYGGCANAGAN